jgi:hypothetical protein
MKRGLRRGADEKGGATHGSGRNPEWPPFVGSFRLRFANVDERLTVWVDDNLPFGDGVIYSPPSTRGPTEANHVEPASIGARGVTVRQGTRHSHRKRFSLLQRRERLRWLEDTPCHRRSPR